MRESALETAFRRHVRTMGGITDKIAPTRKGLPDRLVLLPGGRVRLVELKADGGALSPAQEVYIDRAAQLGIKVDVIKGAKGLDEWVRYQWQTLDYRRVA